MTTNLLLNWNREELFEEVIKNGVFEKYSEKLSEDDYNDLLNEVTFFCSTLVPNIVRE
jgi:hypothetical protein